MKLTKTLALLVLLNLPAAIAAPAPADGNLQVTSKPLSSMFNHKYYKFEGKYPYFTGASPAVTNSLNSSIKSLLTKNIPGNDGNEWSTEATPKDEPNSESSEFTVKRVDKDYLSLIVSLTHIYSGAPHPTTEAHCLNYALGATAKPLTLKDLVGKKANYKLITTMLRKTLSGTNHPTEEPTDFKVDGNDQSFVFDKKGVTWQWSDYAMGTYVSGARAGYLTFKQLSTAAEANSLVTKLAQ